MTLVSEVIRGWLGWCPNGYVLSQPGPDLHEAIVEGASAKGDRISHRPGQLQRYRNKVLLVAIFFTLAATPAVAYFQADDLTKLMVFIGMITGLGFFAFFSRWLWNSFGMLRKGMSIKTGPVDYIISLSFAGIIPLWFIFFIAGILGVISFAGVLAFPAFATGFAFVPWYVFALILLWERRTGYILLFDKKNRSFVAERGSYYASH